MNDVLRLIVLLEASACLWFTVVVLLRYRRRYLQAAHSGTGGRRQRDGQRGKDTPWIGLLPLHVYLVTASTFVFEIQSVALVSSHLGDRVIWYGTPLSLIAFPLLLAALFIVAQYENRVTGRG